MVVRESDLKDWNFLAKLGFQEQNCLWVDKEFQVDLDRRVVISNETISFTTPQQLLRIISYRVWYSEEDSKEVKRFYISRESSPDLVLKCVRKLENVQKFFGIIFCYTNDVDGYMITRRYSDMGTVKSISPIPADE